MSESPLLTVGMAFYDDFYGVDATVQALRMYHAEAMPDTEIVLVDNHPGSPHSKEVQGLIGWCYGRTPEACARAGGTPSLGGFQYLQMAEPVGTAAPRDRVFRAARGRFVLCVDSHVLLWPGALARLIAWARDNPGSRDLVSGPMVYDGLDTYSTHFDDAWRGEMWGTWGSAWQCPACPQLLAVRQDAEGNAAFFALAPGERPYAACPGCGSRLPSLPWARHEAALAEAGFREAAADPGREPFEIPAMGLGLFGCNREAWLGFNPAFRAFGGEEWYLHEKYRRAGARCLCLPFLRWRHRFGRVEKSTYPNTNWHKCRNYVIGHAELGLPLDRVHQHFVGRKKMPEHEWAQLVARPHDPPEWPAGVPRPGQKAAPAAPAPAPAAPAAGPDALDGWLQALKRMQHDFRGHEDWLVRLASEARHVTELGGRRGSSTVCLVAGLARGEGEGRTLRLVDPAAGAEWAELARLGEARGVRLLHDPARSEDSAPAPTDLLVIDTAHHAKQLARELALYAPHASRVVVHDTVLHATRGEGGGGGLAAAVRELLAGTAGWFVMAHDGSGYGLTTLSRLPADRPEAPIDPWPQAPAKAAGAKVQDPGFGPGTELKGLLAAVGISPGTSCDCNARARQMDAWGVEGCRSNRQTIIGWLRDGQSRWGWKDKLAAAARAVTSGLAFRLNPLDPFPSLVDEAIRLAEEKGGKARDA